MMTSLKLGFPTVAQKALGEKRNENESATDM
jgi:hypothetical protein